MRQVTIQKHALHDEEERDDFKDKTPGDRMGMMWQLALDAWAFKEGIDVEPRLQRHVVVVKRRKG